MKPKKICPTCWTLKDMTKHHILPRRHFGNNDLTFDLCRHCHDRVELLIPYDVSSEDDYIRIMIDFLQAANAGKSDSCPKCREQKELVLYQVFPKKYFDAQYQEIVFKLCFECKDDLELRIPQYGLTVFGYAIIFFTYMSETSGFAH